MSDISVYLLWQVVGAMDSTFGVIRAGKRHNRTEELWRWVALWCVFSMHLFARIAWRFRANEPAELINRWWDGWADQSLAGSTGFYVLYFQEDCRYGVQNTWNRDSNLTLCVSIVLLVVLIRSSL